YSDAKPINGPEQRHKREYAQRAEPIRLPVRWGDGKLQSIAFFIPHPAVIAGSNVEAVSPGRQIRVLHSALVDDLSPVLVLAVELESEVHLLRCDQTQCRVINCEISDARRQAQTGSSSICF